MNGEVLEPTTHHRDEERYFYKHDRELIHKEKRATAERKQAAATGCIFDEGELALSEKLQLEREKLSVEMGEG